MTAAHGHPRDSRNRLRLWLQTQHDRSPGWEGGEIRVTYDGGSTHESLMVAQLPTHTLTDCDLAAAEILELAGGDCSSRGSRSQYLVQLYTREERVTATHVLRLKPDVAEGPELAEAPDARGIIAQLMRHQEATSLLTVKLAQQQQQQVATILDAQTRVIEALTTRLAHAEAELEDARAALAKGSGKMDKLLDMAESVLPALLEGGSK